MTTTQSTKRQRYDSFGITELRRMAREAKISGRSKMDGWQLLTAMRQYWTERRVTAEQAVIDAAKPGAILRHKSSGYTLRVTSAPEPSKIDVQDGALRFHAEYIEWPDDQLYGAWKGHGTDYARYLNEQQARRVENGHHADWHMLWQYEAA